METENPFADLPTLETARLILRRLRMDDAADVFEYGREPDVARYVSWPPHKSIEDSRAYLNVALDLYARQEPAPWGLVLKDSGKLIGTCGLFDWRIQHRRAEIGYAIGKAHWGQGYVPEAARTVLRFGFEQVGLNRIQALCNVPNAASAQVMEKIGMSYEGILRQYLCKAGDCVDMKIYAILRAAWLAQQAVES